LIQKIVDFWLGLPDPVRRAVRTFAQTFAAVFTVAVVAIVGDLQSGLGLADALNAVGAAAISAVLAAVAALLAFVQNAIEDARGVAK
jgi:hypothetical protein